VIGTQDARRCGSKLQPRVPVSRPAPAEQSRQSPPMSRCTRQNSNADDGRPEVVRDVVEFMESQHRNRKPFFTAEEERVVSRWSSVVNCNPLQSPELSLRGRQATSDQRPTTDSNLKLQLHPSNANSTPSGSVRFVASCGRSWQMCVKNARFGLPFPRFLSDCPIVECVG